MVVLDERTSHVGGQLRAGGQMERWRDLECTNELRNEQTAELQRPSDR